MGCADDVDAVITSQSIELAQLGLYKVMYLDRRTRSTTGYCKDRNGDANHKANSHPRAYGYRSGND